MSTLNPNPLPPPNSDDLEWITEYLTIHYLSTPSWVYTYILWIAFAAVFILFSIAHLLGLHGGYFGAWWDKWALRRRTWRKKQRLTHAIKTGQLSLQPKALPPNAQILTLAFIIAASWAVCYLGPDYIAPGYSLWNVRHSPTASISKRVILADYPYTSTSPQYTVSKTWWSSAARAGQVTFALFPLCILLALKMPPFALLSISFFTNLHFDKLAWLHTWVGAFLWFMATIHVVSWSVQLTLDRRVETGKIAYTYAFLYSKFIYGWCAYVALSILTLSSWAGFRRKHYEVFYFLHIILVPVILIMAALHHTQVWWWCWAALGLWGCERIYRFTWYLNTNGLLSTVSRHSAILRKRPSLFSLIGRSPKFDLTRLHPLGLSSLSDKSPAAIQKLSHHTDGYIPPAGFFHADLLPGRTVRLRIITPGFLSWAPGQHFLVKIPSVSHLTSHPFTIASVSDEVCPSEDGRELVFIIRAKKGWTKNLWDKVAGMITEGDSYLPSENLPPRCNLPARGVLLRGYVDGPFGSSGRADWESYSSVLLVTGGSGVSFGLSVLTYLCLCLQGRNGGTLGGHSGSLRKRSVQVTRVRFVWCVREFGHIQWGASILRRCMAMCPSPELQVDIFVTNAVPNLTQEPMAIGPRLGELDEDDLPPPIPEFAKEAYYMKRSGRHSRSSSVSSGDSDASADSDVETNYFSPGYGHAERGDHAYQEHILDLTNWDGDDDTAIPGERQLNMTVKQEGKKRRNFFRRKSAATSSKQDLKARSSRLFDTTQPPSFAKVAHPKAPLPGPLQPITEHIRQSAYSRSLYGMDSPSPPPITPSTTSAVPLLCNEGLLNPSLSMASSSTNPNRPSFPRPLSRPLSEVSQKTDCSEEDDGTSFADDAASEANTFENLRLELDETELGDISVVAERARPGKPKLDKLLAHEVERSQGAVVVGCCGPTGLNAMIRKAIAAQINPARISQGDMRGLITLVSEDYEW